MAALAAVVTGCASTPPPTASAAGSPASTAELRDMADFTKKAQEEGWRPTIRGGQVLYCMNDAPMGSRLSDETCLNETSLRQQMLAEEHQRQSMQRPGAAGCPQPGAC
jgi:hypothetical protein